MPVNKGLRILIVDDQDTVLEILREFLRAIGFRQVQEARSAREALTMMRSAPEPFGLVFSDWNMQPTTGLQLLTAVRGDPALKATPFIMITGETTKERVVAAIDAGVTGYMAKPFSLETLKKRLIGVLGEF
jgi:two-component system chemotaxis response regulator CheY